MSDHLLTLPRMPSVLLRDLATITGIDHPWSKLLLKEADRRESEEFAQQEQILASIRRIIREDGDAGKPQPTPGVVGPGTHLSEHEGLPTGERAPDERNKQYRHRIRAAIPDRFLLDPPDSGDVSTLEGVERMVKRIAKLEKSEDQLIGERDTAENAISDMYTAVLGRAPEWSNLFCFADAVRDVRDHASNTEARIAELEKDIYVPGQFECPNCKLVAMHTVLHVKTGGTSAAPSMDCANGCGPMWRVTWKQRAKEAIASFETLFDEKKALEEAAKKFRAAFVVAVGDRSPFAKTALADIDQAITTGAANAG